MQSIAYSVVVLAGTFLLATGGAPSPERPLLVIVGLALIGGGSAGLWEQRQLVRGSGGKPPV